MPDLTLITEQILARVPGGTGRFSREVAEALAASSPPEWSVRGLTAWHGDVAAARVPGMAGPTRLPVGARVLPRLWQRGLPPRVPGDLVHALTPLAPQAKAGQRLVVTVFDAVPYTHPETLTPHGAAWHRTMIERAARDADAVVSTTQATVDALAAAGVKPAERVLVCGAGVSPLWSASVPPEQLVTARHQFDLPSRYALVVGTLEPRKGLDVLLDALLLTPEVRLVVVGPPGWGNTDLQSEVARRNLSDRVRQLGALTDAELRVVLSGATVQVQPSRAEGFGLPVAEAMAAGVPVVHTDVPALVEVAGGAGLSVPIGDPAALAQALTRIWSDPALAGRLRIAGRARAAEFTWSAVAGRLWALYRELLDQH